MILRKRPYLPEDRPRCTPLVITSPVSLLADFSTALEDGMDDGLPIIIDGSGNIAADGNSL